MQAQDIPYGYCQCGCGEKTKAATITRRDRGWVKGQPLRFVNSHGARKPAGWWLPEYTEQPGPLESSCWIWNGARDDKGYGQRLHISGRYLDAHQAFYVHHVGEVPEGLELDHLCRTRACVNPAHLEPVTHAENMQRGAMAKLTRDSVRTIRTLSSEGRTALELAALFGVSRDAIYLVVNRKTWRDVE